MKYLSYYNSVQRAVTLLGAMAVIGFTGLATAAPPVVKTVPAFPSRPLIPHDTYSGKLITLKGTCDRQGAALQWTWDFGDGNPVATGTVTDRYVIEAQHAYTGASGLFVARLTITDTGTGESASKPYYVFMHDLNILDRASKLQVRINIATDEGLWFLHKTQIRSADGVYGDWTSGSAYGNQAASSYYGISVLNINAFEVNGHRETGNADDPYVETVQRGMRRLFSWLSPFSLSGTQNYGLCSLNLDSNTNGLGILCASQGSGYSDLRPYQSGMFMDAIIASGTPDAIATTGSANVIGRKYRDIIQDMVDGYAWAQYDGSEGGGWRYAPNQAPDNSACQWAAIGLIPAERNWGCVVPDCLKQWNIQWLKYSQASDGHFGYMDTSCIWGCYATTASGLVQLAMDGIGRGALLPGETASRWDKAETYLRDRFCNSGNPTTALRDYYYAMFSFVKAMIYHVPEIKLHQSQTAGVPPIDWQKAEASEGDPCDGVAKTLVLDQSSNGYWSGHDVDSTQFPMETAMAVMMLKVAIVDPPPIPVVVITPNPAMTNQLIKLDGSGSYTDRPNARVDSWEWDFDCDGTVDAVGPVAWVSFPTEGTNCIRLHITDDGTPEKETTVDYSVVIRPPPIAPTCDAGGPYVFCPQSKPWLLNGLGSVNPDEGQSEPGAPGDTIVEYAWDLDGDNDFNDAFGPVVDVTAYLEALGPTTNLVQLRVRDRSSISFPSFATNDLTSTCTAEVSVKAETDECCACLALTASAVRCVGVQLAWSANTNAAFYEVDRGTTAGGPYDNIATTADGTTTTFVDTNVVFVPATTYYYVVKAVANGIVICQSEEVSAKAVCNVCPVPLCKNITVTNDPGQCSATITAAMVDNGSYDPDGDAISLAVEPSVVPRGTTTVKLIVCETDSEHLCCECYANVTVVDGEAPRMACRPAPNPSAKKIPVAGKNPPSGQNPDGYYQLLAEDNCDAAPAIYIKDTRSAYIAGPFQNGDIVKISQNPGGTPRTDPGTPPIVGHLHLTGDALGYSVDAAGNVSGTCLMLIPPDPK